jgi:hypothetical protein
MKSISAFQPAMLSNGGRWQILDLILRFNASVHRVSPKKGLSIRPDGTGNRAGFLISQLYLRKDGQALIPNSR